MGRLRHRKAEEWCQGAAEAGSEGASSSRKLSLLSCFFFPVRILLVSHPPVWPTLDAQGFIVQPSCSQEILGSQDEMKIRPKEQGSPQLPHKEATLYCRGPHPSRTCRPALLTQVRFYLELDRPYEIPFPRFHLGLTQVLSQGTRFPSGPLQFP